MYLFDLFAIDPNDDSNINIRWDIRRRVKLSPSLIDVFSCAMISPTIQKLFV